MEEDLIVVDDPQPTQTAATGRPQRVTTLRARRQSSPAYSDGGDTTSARAMPSSAKTKAAPKLKLKLSEKTAALAPGMSFLGPYDRELDSDDEELAFEEQFILRMPLERTAASYVRWWLLVRSHLVSGSSSKVSS
jgi:transcription initiation factor TFIID subunit 7